MCGICSYYKLLRLKDFLKDFGMFRAALGNVNNNNMSNNELSEVTQTVRRVEEFFSVFAVYLDVLSCFC